MTDCASVIAIPVSTGWASPAAPRDVDRLATAENPDITGWLAAMDARGPDGRLGLHGRVVTQFVGGEPVDVIDESGDWMRVVGPWQPTGQDTRGYPAWVPACHLADRSTSPTLPLASTVAPDRRAICESARGHLGLRYLWGGTTPYGLDCSGLVHTSYRSARVVVPRDAHDQYLAAAPVPLGEEEPGDLYFFAHDDGQVFHVGFVTGARTMLHAPQTGQLIEEAALSPDRIASLIAVGRFLT